MEQIPLSVTIGFGVATFCTILLPICVAIFLFVKKTITAKPFFLGFACFFATQFILRIPLLSIATQFKWFDTLANNLFVYAFIIGGLSAGLFEETGRLFIAKYGFKENLTFKIALGFGLGHAFSEMILLIGMSNISNFAMAIIVSGSGEALGAKLTPEAITEVTTAFTAINSPDIYLGILERFSTVVFHIFATMLVFKAVSEKKYINYLYAILAHTLFNGVAVILMQYTNIWISELYILLCAIAGLIYIKKYYAYCVYNGIDR